MAEPDGRAGSKVDGAAGGGVDRGVEDLDLATERRFNDLVLAALEVAPADRRRRLVELAGEAPELIDEVLASLDDELGDFLENPAALDLSHDPEPRAEPRWVGPYTLGERLGSGGMGEVRRGSQEVPVRREVAIKLVRTHLQGAARSRFVAEQRALARLNHTHVTRFFEAGTTDDGAPWFAMELLDGEPLSSYCDRKALDLRARLGLFLGVCAGVEHAHQNQLLHRDLKPSNILVVEEDGRPVAKVIDFGIAKFLDPGGDGTLQTSGALLGTPAYMSPEALSAEGGSGAVDTRADVYSLGVLLFELLTGQRPFDDDHLGLVERIERRRDHEPVTPSSRLDGLAAEDAEGVARRRSSDRSTLVRTIEHDLDWIVAKALAPDRERRYASVGALAADLRRFLGDEPVEARPPSASYRLGKLLRRHRLLAAGAAVALLGILAGTVGLAVGLVRAREEAEAARRALSEAREVSDFLVHLFEVADPNHPEPVSAQELLDRGVAEIPGRFADQPAARGRFLQTLADVYAQMGRWDQAEPMLFEAAGLFEASLPADDPAHASILHSLGALYNLRRDWPRAEGYYRQALARSSHEMKPEVRALYRHDLGVVAYRQRRHDEAEALFREARDLRRLHLDPDHPHQARSDNALGALMLSTERPREAVAFLESAIEHGERNLGPEHLHVGMALQNLGIAWRDLGDDDRALEIFERSLKIQEKALGPDHPDLDRILLRLRSQYTKRGDSEATEEVLTRLLASQRRRHGEESAEVGRTLVRLADLLYDQGRLDGAETFYRESATAYAGALPSDHVSHEMPRLGIAAVAWQRGELDHAETLFEQVLVRREAHHGTAHRSLAFTLWGLAEIHADTDRPRLAEGFFCRALEVYVVTGESLGTYEEPLRQGYVDFLRLQGRHDEVGPILDQRGLCTEPPSAP